MQFNKNLVLLSLLISFMFSGCATFLSGTYSQKVDPNYKIAPQDTILVTTNENDLDSKFYVNYVANALKNKGFYNVYRYIDTKLPPIRYTVVIQVYQKTKTYTYNSADYGYKWDGTVTTKCTKHGNTTECVKTRNKVYGIIGYSNKIGHIDGHYFIMNWYENVSKEKIFFAEGSTTQTDCTNDKLYQFLIDESIKRMNFQKPMDDKFTVQMPEGYTCR
ncbi:MAG: hypothetical protein R3331_01245 [Sulfurospirillaceae bacterium]|nr:hypothetical protein [Sulfurospirillaceae bacterium]